MLSFMDIIQINKGVTSRSLSEDAASYLSDGCQKYTSQGMQYLGHSPTRQEAEAMVRKVLSKLDTGGGMITLNEVSGLCGMLPYPFNLWFC